MSVAVEEEAIADESVAAAVALALMLLSDTAHAERAVARVFAAGPEEEQARAVFTRSTVLV
jgi:hypothetical protein